jgi:putative oxidoreductase
MKNSNPLLTIAALMTFGVAVFQAAIVIVPEWSVAFDAPETLLSNPPLLLAAGLMMALVFAVCGLYGLSGAGLIRRLPLLRLGLLVIGLIATYRGLAFFFQLAAVLNILPSSQPIPWTHWISSLAALFIGLAYLSGLATGWKRMTIKANRAVI